MMREKLDFWKFTCEENLCVNFHLIAVKDTSCTINLLAKF